MAMNCQLGVAYRLAQSALFATSLLFKASNVSILPMEYRVEGAKVKLVMMPRYLALPTAGVLCTLIQTQADCVPLCAAIHQLALAEFRSQALEHSSTCDKESNQATLHLPQEAQTLASLLDFCQKAATLPAHGGATNLSTTCACF